MSKFWKIFGFIFLGIICILYLSFLFVIPNVMDINKYKPEIQKLVKEQANLSIDFENPKIITTPLLGAGLKTENISVKLPDNTVLFSADSLKTRVALPSIFLLTVKVSCFELSNPFVNLEILNDKQYKIASHIENILNKDKEQKLEAGENPENPENSWFNPAWIRIKVPSIVLNNYKVLVNDLKNKHYLELKGEKLYLGYFNGKSAKIKTNAELFSDENKNITANIDINTFLPEPSPGLDNEDDKAERIDIPFVNAVKMFRNYDPKFNLDTKLYIREGKQGIKSYGHFNIENLTLKVSNLIIPVSYLKAKTFGTNLNIDTDVYLAKEQNIQILGKLNYSNTPKLDMSIRTAEIKFNDLLNLIRAFLDSLSIKHELANYTATGTIKSDCYIKTNFKKLHSNGSVIIKDGGVYVKGIGKVLSNANINIILDNNILNIKNSGILVNNSKIFIDGKIDDKSITDISIKADKIPLNMLFHSFAPRELKRAYNFRSGDITFNLSITGKLKDAVTALHTNIENLNLGDSIGNFVISDKIFNGEFYVNSKEIKGLLKNKDLRIMLPKSHSNIYAPNFETEILNKDIIIRENIVKFNDNSEIKYSGEIINFENPKTMSFKADGKISTEDIVKLIGREFKRYIHSNGNLPLKLTFDGNKKKQTLFAQILTDKDNFITPIDFAELLGKNISLQSVVDFKGNRIKIKKTGFFTRIVTVDEKGNEIVNLDEIFGVDGTIVKDRINLIKITMPETLSGKIFVFPRSNFKIHGKAFIFGETSSPRIRGGFEINTLSIPELLLDLRKFILKFRGQEIDLTTEDLILNGSDLNTKTTFNIIQPHVFTIMIQNVRSRYFNVDKLMPVVERAMKYIPENPAGNTTQSNNNASIPLDIRSGEINFAEIVTGNIDVRNTTSQISLHDNIFYLDNLKTRVFDGSAKGDISMNLITSLLNIKLQGQDVKVEKAMSDAVGMKGMLSGTAEFDTDISLEGSAMEEQMKSLKGDVNFKVKNGQFGPFGKLENLILAENIRESQFFQTAIGGMLSGLLTIDTTHFAELAGTLKFDNGICYIDPITSSGDILALHLFGNFDLLKNRIDMKVRARMASLISNLLGPLNAINPINLVNNAASMNVITAKAFSLFCEVAPAEEIAALPSFANSYIDNSATKFQIVVRGDVAKPLTLVKSFKWLTTQMEFAKAKEFADSLPDPEEGSTATNIEEAIAEYNATEAKKKTLGYKTIEFGKKLIHPFGRTNENK